MIPFITAQHENVIMEEDFSFSVLRSRFEQDKNGNKDGKPRGSVVPSRVAPPPPPPLKSISSSVTFRSASNGAVHDPSASLPPTQTSPKPVILRSKPPIAPKPKHLLGDYKPAETAPRVPERRESLVLSNNEKKLAAVRLRAKEIEKQLYMDAMARIPPGSVPQITMKSPSLPEEDDDKDTMSGISDLRNGQDGETSERSFDDFADSEDDSDKSRSNVDSASVFTRTSQRYASQSSGYGSQDIHSLIMKELVSKGITNLLPNTVGKMRHSSKRQDARSVSASLVSPSSAPSLASPQSLASSNVSSNNSSMASESGTVTTMSDSRPVPTGLQAPEYVVPDYEAADEKERSRLKKLHWAALEFLTVQKSFVEYLNMIVNVYPNYLIEYGVQSGKPILATASTSAAANHYAESVTTVHVVYQIQRLLSNYYNFHSQVLLVDIQKTMDNWNSHEPCMASVFKVAQFLKECTPFLKEKSRIADELTRLVKEDPEFAVATTTFERRVFNRGIGGVIQQLDQVHQNFMRYKILMQRYAEYLPEGSKELEETHKVIETLEKINAGVNTKMGLPTGDQLMRLSTLFQGQFDVFKPGRRLLRQENVDKQTRKETQPRTLVLFSDTLWLCRVMSSLGNAGLFDVARSYQIPIDQVRLEVKDHKDWDCYMEIRSKSKSAGLWFKCQSARDEWKRLIEQAATEQRALRERIQAARKKSGNSFTTNAEMDSVTVLARQGSGITAPSVSRPHSIVLTTVSSHNHTTTHDEDDSDFDPETPVADGAPETLWVNHGGRRDAITPEVEKPVWINDKMSTKCLMAGCENEFNLFHRRHHCRNCGYLICKKCRGYAPVKSVGYDTSSLVCPECYDYIEAEYKSGTLFPPSMLLEVSPGVYWLAVNRGPHGKERIERINPALLFSPPVNRGLRRLDDIDKRFQAGKAVFGKVHLKTKGREALVHARLSDDGLVLEFYKAAYDTVPMEQHVIYGYSLNEEEIGEGSSRGRRFVLRHQNQHGSEQRIISFRAKANVADMWSSALSKALQPDDLDRDDTVVEVS